MTQGHPLCHPCQAAGNLNTEAYGRRITGMGQSYRERLRDQVACREYGEMLAVVSLSGHLMTQHGRAAGRRRKWTTPAAGRVPQVYRTSFLANGGRGRQCGCTSFTSMSLTPC